MARYEISPGERYDEQVRDYHDFDGPHEDGHSFMPGIDRHHIARLMKRELTEHSDPGRAGAVRKSRGGSRSVNPDKEAA